MESGQTLKTDLPAVTFGIAEDEEIAGLALGRFIETYFPQAEVRWIRKDGAQALEALRSEPADVLIADISMPVMSGLELCEILTRENYPGVMLIYTAHARFAYAKKAVALNVFDYILKPCSDEDLRDTLERCIQESIRRKAEREQEQSVNTLISDVQKYALSLAAFGPEEGKQLQQFLRTVEWPAEGIGVLQTCVMHFLTLGTFSARQVRHFSEWASLLEKSGYRVSTDYVEGGHFLAVLQPEKKQLPAEFYVRTKIAARMAFENAQERQMKAYVSECCDSYTTINAQCHRKYEWKGNTGTSAWDQITCDGGRWRMIRVSEEKKYANMLERYLLDGNYSRTRNLLERLIQTEDWFWEAALLAVRTAEKLWPEVDFTPLYPGIAHGRKTAGYVEGQGTEESCSVRRSADYVECQGTEGSGSACRPAGYEGKQEIGGSAALPGEAFREETDFPHGCDFADVAAKSSSVASKSEYKTMFWEEVLYGEDNKERWLREYLSCMEKPGRSDGRDAMAHLLEWMQKHCAEDVTLGNAAARMGMETAYFSKYFKKTVGRNFVDVLTDYRMQRAERLLQEQPDLTLARLCEECGFSSKTYFSEVYKKWKGMTLTQYLKEIRN